MKGSEGVIFDIMGSSPSVCVIKSYISGLWILQGLLIFLYKHPSNGQNKTPQNPGIFVPCENAVSRHPIQHHPSSFIGSISLLKNSHPANPYPPFPPTHQAPQVTGRPSAVLFPTVLGVMNSLLL